MADGSTSRVTDRMQDACTVGGCRHGQAFGCR